MEEIKIVFGRVEHSKVRVLAAQFATFGIHYTTQGDYHVADESREGPDQECHHTRETAERASK